MHLQYLCASQPQKIRKMKTQMKTLRLRFSGRKGCLDVRLPLSSTVKDVLALLVDKKILKHSENCTVASGITKYSMQQAVTEIKFSFVEVTGCFVDNFSPSCSEDYIRQIQSQRLQYDNVDHNTAYVTEIVELRDNAAQKFVVNVLGSLVDEEFVLGKVLVKSLQGEEMTENYVILLQFIDTVLNSSGSVRHRAKLFLEKKYNIFASEESLHCSQMGADMIEYMKRIGAGVFTV